jgi:hypothetical protein
MNTTNTTIGPTEPATAHCSVCKTPMAPGADLAIATRQRVIKQGGLCSASCAGKAAASLYARDKSETILVLRATDDASPEAVGRLDLELKRFEELCSKVNTLNRESRRRLARRSR